MIAIPIFLTKTTAAQSEDALSYDRMCALYLLAVVFAAIIVNSCYYPYCLDKALRNYIRPIYISATFLSFYKVYTIHCTPYNFEQLKNCESIFLEYF